MADTRLTWHVGSVLPYASLWHTVLRACALNALHPHELPCQGAHPAATVELLEHAGRVDIAAFARWLGEPPEAFRWSTLGVLPPWLSAALAVPRPRLCFACLAAGYHTALFSIALLDACPIHGTPLVDRCHCGAPFHAMPRSQADYAAAGSCRCGRLHFFTHETCRRPTLAPGATRVLDPLAAWLDALPELIRSARLDEALGQAAPGSLEWVCTAAQALGLAYPACLRPISFVPAQISTVWCRPRPQQTPSRERLPPPLGQREHRKPSYWPPTPATGVYRALARHVRRHLAPDGARWSARFIDSCDPLAISAWVGGSPRARQAFIDLLWGRAAEPRIEQRRWPDRPPLARTAGELAEPVQADCQVRGADHAEAATRHWLACHAARVSLGALWRDAQARATAAAWSGVAAWADAATDTSWRDSAWLARLMPGGLGFVAPISADWMAAAAASKAMRQLADAARRQARRDTMWAASRGACLTWSEENGWDVVEAIAPADADVRRRRLLGLSDGRPWCWLYRAADGRFVARWHQAPLQVAAATPGAALAGLRRGAHDYQRMGRVALPFPSPTRAMTPEPIVTQASANYQFFVAVVRRRQGFWHDARDLTDAARCYRQSRALPEGAGR
jgi:hypothetical protein